MEVYGKVLKVFPDERIIKIEYKNRLLCLYMTRKTFKDFGPYFYKEPYIFVEISNEAKMYGKYYGYEIISFVKIVETGLRERIIYYDIETIRGGVKNLINKTKNKMFLDLEFTLPSFYQTIPHVAEIVQYGIVVEDENGNIVFKESNLVKPNRKFGINQRTLNFISRKREEFDDALTYQEFYEKINDCLSKYNAKIIAWGKSDILMLEQSFALNKVKPLNVRKRYINLMQVIKNYYNIKEDMGLFNTYQEYASSDAENQIHDALEDAMVTREIFRMFKERLNNKSEIL